MLLRLCPSQISLEIRLLRSHLLLYSVLTFNIKRMTEGGGKKKYRLFLIKGSNCLCCFSLYFHLYFSQNRKDWACFFPLPQHKGARELEFSWLSHIFTSAFDVGMFRKTLYLEPFSLDALWIWYMWGVGAGPVHRALFHFSFNRWISGSCFLIKKAEIITYRLNCWHDSMTSFSQRI